MLNEMAFGVLANDMVCLTCAVHWIEGSMPPAEE